MKKTLRIKIEIGDGNRTYGEESFIEGSFERKLAEIHKVFMGEKIPVKKKTR